MTDREIALELAREIIDETENGERWGGRVRTDYILGKELVELEAENKELKKKQWKSVVDARILGFKVVADNRVPSDEIWFGSEAYKIINIENR